MTYGPPYLKDIVKTIAWFAIGITALAAIALACIPSLADAHPLHRGHHAHHNGLRTHSHRHSLRVAAPVAGSHWWSGYGSAFGSSLVAEARSQLGKGAVYGRSNLWCARFVNYVLKQTGRPGTNSDMAASFAHYGTRVNGPEVGAIAVMSRRGGGHVGIVSGVDSAGNPIVISGNNLNSVREAVYPRSRVYAYVVPN
jgi:uncharacterized protein (TIGR02594 family)